MTDERSKEWYMNMAELEGDNEIAAGVSDSEKTITNQMPNKLDVYHISYGKYNNESLLQFSPPVSEIDEYDFSEYVRMDIHKKLQAENEWLKKENHRLKVDNLSLGKFSELLKIETSEIETRSDEIEQDSNSMRKKLVAQNATMTRLREVISFFACVIKSGEPWTETCQQSYDEVMDKK